ncbi:MAG TPA: tetratricopeptide repeat protein [Nitrospira sp.]|jgi:Tfp pilus assembly protein PilF
MRIVLTIILCAFALGCSSKPGTTRNVLPAPSGTKPEAAAQVQKGNSLFASQDFAGAEQAFRQAILADAGLAEAHYNLALSLDQTGRKDEARKHYIEAANLAPGNKIIWDSPPLRQRTGGLNYDVEKKSYLDPNSRGY